MTDEALRRADRLLTDLVELIETARAMPMSSSCVIPREHALDLLDDLRDVFPVEMVEARRITAQRDTVLAEAGGQAERLQAEATRVLDAATVAAQDIVGAAHEQAAATRAEADAYLREAQAKARAQAQELIEDGRAEHLRLVSSTGVHQAAVSIAERVRLEAEEYAAGTRAEVDQRAATAHAAAARAADALREDSLAYAERTLGDLLAVLTRAVTTTEHGRQELLRRAGPDRPGKSTP